IVVSVNLPALLGGRVVLDRVHVEGAAINLERSADGKRNWTLAKSEDSTAGTPEIRKLSVKNSLIRYLDPIHEVDLQARVNTNDNDPLLPVNTVLSGSYRKLRVAGTVTTGDVLSLQDSSMPFPAKVDLSFGKTAVKINGTLSDLIKGGIIDAKLSVAGPDLSLLYPVIPVVLPSSPPYRISGQLKRNGAVYRYEEFEGVIGKSDVSGTASYTANTPPTLKMVANSKQLDLADLGPLIGLQPGPANSSKQANSAAAAGNTPGKVLPNRPFRLERLNAMNADVTLTAGRILRPGDVPLEDMRVHLQLDSGQLTLMPLE